MSTPHQGEAEAETTTSEPAPELPPPPTGAPRFELPPPGTSATRFDLPPPPA